MRYLKSMNEFLYKEVTIDKSTINEQIKSSKMISEAFENDIRWGDSLVGRLINSAIRTVKIGYNETKIPKILEELKGQIDQLIADSLTMETGEKCSWYSVLLLLETMKDLCLSTMSDEDKLVELIGWDKSTAMWDTNDPRSAIPGFVDDQRRIISTPSIMQNIIDKVTTKIPNLKKLIGDDRDKFIDKLCDFSEELRKLTVDGSVGGNNAQITPFSSRMGSLLNRLQSVNESLRLSRYYNFINEDNETTSNIKKLKVLSSELSKEIESKEENEIKGLDKFKKFKGVFFKLNDNEKEKLKVKVDDEEKNLYDLLVDLLSDGGESEKEGSEEQGSGKGSYDHTVALLKSILSLKDLISQKAPSTPTKNSPVRNKYSEEEDEDDEKVTKKNGVSENMIYRLYEDNITINGQKTGSNTSITGQNGSKTDDKSKPVDNNNPKSDTKTVTKPEDTKPKPEDNKTVAKPAAKVEPTAKQNQTKSNIEIAWNKVTQSFTKSGADNVINDIKATLENLNSNDEKKKKFAQEVVNGISKQIVANTMTIGKNRLNYGQLIHEDIFNDKEKSVNNISKVISLVSNVIMGFKDQEILKNGGPKSEFLKSFITNYDALTIKKESWILLENNFNPGGGTGSTTGGTGSTIGGTTNPSDDDKRTVKGLWDAIWKPYEEKMMSEGDGPHRLTQRMVDDLQSMIDKGEDKKVLDLSKRPDPLIAIVRVCRKAHNTYFTDLIPSGRKDGMVSNKTFREYIFLGGSNTRPDPNRLNGEGPWAVKSIWEKWTDGVTKILEDQQYRKILSNVEFIVPGAEDVFNPKKNESKIYEAETGNRLDDGELTKGSKHGTIILDFLSEMIDKESVRDFEGSRKKLMKKYFGIVTGSPDRIPNVTPILPGSEDQKNSIVWNPIQSSKNKFIDVDKNKLFLFPVKDERKDAGSTTTKKHEIIFLQVLDVINGGKHATVKFTYDRPVMAKKWRGLNAPSYDYHDWASTTRVCSEVYYGVMLNRWDNRKLSIVYCNVKDKDNNPSNVWGEPRPGQKFNFKIDTTSLKTLPNSTFSGHRSALSICILQKVDENGSRTDVLKRDIICFNESIDTDLKIKKFGTTQDTIVKTCIEKGKDPSHNFWQ